MRKEKVKRKREKGNYLCYFSREMVSARISRVEAEDVDLVEPEREEERLPDLFETRERRARRLRLPLVLPEASDVLSEAIVVTSADSAAASRTRSSRI